MSRWSIMMVPVVVVMAGVVWVLDPDTRAPDGAGLGDSAATKASVAAADSAACALESGPHPLPRVIRESSGIARTADGSLWTHNDGGEAVLYRVDEGGQLRQTVRLFDVDARDVEDIDAGPCPSGTGECLWLADTGDNDNERDDVALLAVPVPAPDAASAQATRVTFTYPDGPRDAEALAVLASGDAIVVSKGRGAPIVVYRLNLGTTDAARRARRIVQVAPEPDSNRNRVTGAAASEDGAWIAMRTNDALALYRTDALLAGDVAPVLTYDLRPLNETQGEGIEVAADGRVWLTSEGERGFPSLARLRCVIPR